MKSDERIYIITKIGMATDISSYGILHLKLVPKMM